MQETKTRGKSTTAARRHKAKHTDRRRSGFRFTRTSTALVVVMLFLAGSVVGLGTEIADLTRNIGSGDAGDGIRLAPELPDLPDLKDDHLETPGLNKDLFKLPESMAEYTHVVCVPTPSEGYDHFVIYITETEYEVLEIVPAGTRVSLLGLDVGTCKYPWEIQWSFAGPSTGPIPRAEGAPGGVLYKEPGSGSNGKSSGYDVLCAPGPDGTELYKVMRMEGNRAVLLELVTGDYKKSEQGFDVSECTPQWPFYAQAMGGNAPESPFKQSKGGSGPPPANGP